jgi:hypothetical protein
MTTNATGLAVNASLAYIKSLDAAWMFGIEIDGHLVFPERNHGIKVPTIDEFLERYHLHDMNIEIKNNNRTAAELLIRSLEKYDGMKQRTIISSAHCDMMSYVRQHSNYCTGACESESMYFVLSYLLGLSDIWKWLNWSPAGSLVFQFPTHSAGLHLDTAEIIKDIHIQDQAVQYWVRMQRQ